MAALSLKVVETGSRLELTNSTKDEVLVIGYLDEPYLRVGPEGVFENTRSPATYLNVSRRGATRVPGSADPSAPPEWREVSSAPVARWHDHRIHWMSDQAPPAVRRAPGRTHVVIPEWVVTMRMGATAITATGDLVWVPGPSPVPWLLPAAGFLAVVLALAARFSWEGLAAALALLVAADAAHALGIAWSAAGSAGAKLGVLLPGSLASIVAWGGAGGHLDALAGEGQPPPGGRLRRRGHRPLRRLRRPQHALPIPGSLRRQRRLGPPGGGGDARTGGGDRHRLGAGPPSRRRASGRGLARAGAPPEPVRPGAKRCRSPARPELRPPAGALPGAEGRPPDPRNHLPGRAFAPATDVASRRARREQEDRTMHRSSSPARRLALLLVAGGCAVAVGLGGPPAAVAEDDEKNPIQEIVCALNKDDAMCKQEPQPGT